MKFSIYLNRRVFVMTHINTNRCKEAQMSGTRLSLLFIIIFLLKSFFLTRVPYTDIRVLSTFSWTATVVLITVCNIKVNERYIYNFCFILMSNHFTTSFDVTVFDLSIQTPKLLTILVNF